MAYHLVDSTDIAPEEGIPGDHRYLDSIVDLQNFSMQVIEAQAGEDFAPYHTHSVQEEVFFVIEGNLHVTTPGDSYVVGPGHFFVAEPENPLHPHNPEDADSAVRAVLVNAPHADDFEMYDAD